MLLKQRNDNWHVLDLSSLASAKIPSMRSTNCSQHHETICSPGTTCAAQRFNCFYSFVRIEDQRKSGFLWRKQTLAFLLGTASPTRLWMQSLCFRYPLSTFSVKKTHDSSPSMFTNAYCQQSFADVHIIIALATHIKEKEESRTQGWFDVKLQLVSLYLQILEPHEAVAEVSEIGNV